MCNLIYNVYACWEVFDQSPIDINTVSLLLDVEIVVSKVKVVHPVILTGPGFEHLKHPSIVLTSSSLAYQAPKLEPSGP